MNVASGSRREMRRASNGEDGDKTEGSRVKEDGEDG